MIPFMPRFMLISEDMPIDIPNLVPNSLKMPIKFAFGNKIGSVN